MNSDIINNSDEYWSGESESYGSESDEFISDDDLTRNGLHCVRNSDYGYQLWSYD